MRSNTKQEAQVNTKSSDVCSCLAADPKDTKMSIIVEFVEFTLVYRSDTELTLDSRNQWRSLEKCTGQRFKSSSELRLTTRDLVVQADHADIFFSCTLLRFNQTSGTVNANN